MKVATTSFIEHLSLGEQDVVAHAGANAQLLVPGACTSCSWGCGCSSSCSCCGAISVSEGKVPEE